MTLRFQDPFMRRAYRLACLGAGRTHPNPLVGAVVARDGRIVGEGTHIYARKGHAERIALEQAGDTARGADLYVTLEPCAHHGRTPPCVEAIVAAGVRRVFCGMIDPNPLVAGRGIEFLRRSGVEVSLADDPSPFREMNRAFVKFITRRQPWVVLKAALTLDGRIAPASGRSQWITGPRARTHGQFLRFLCDAILVGAGTVLADNPLLTCRYKKAKDVPLVRVVLDPGLRIPPATRLVQTARDHPLLVYTTAGAPGPARDRLAAAGAAVVAVDGDGQRLSLDQVLDDLGHRRIASLLVEGGSRTLTGFVRSGLADEFYFFYGPKLLGEGSLPLLGDIGTPELAGCPVMSITECRPMPPDIMVHGLFLR